MRPAELVRDNAFRGNIATPSRPGRLPGVMMAGFHGGSADLADFRFVPHPAVTVFIDLGDGLLVDQASGQRLRGSCAAGLVPGVALRGRGREIECLQIRLSPAVAHAVLGASPEISGTVAAFADLWGRDAARFHEQLRAASSWDERFALAEAALAGRQAAGRAVDPEIAFAWERLTASGGQVRVERLAAATGWSRKRLWSRFRSQIGLTPKRAAQLVRFDHAAHRLAAGRRPALVAAESGYADQSHLHHEVMAFAGMTPAAVATTPWLSVDPVAWPSAATRT
jgi:AraC-like DNA-binding protein